VNESVNEQHITAALEREATGAVPVVQLWPAIEREITGAHRTATRRPTLRLVAGLAVVAALLLLIATLAVSYLPARQPGPPANPVALAPTTVRPLATEAGAPKVLAARLVVDAQGNVSVAGEVGLVNRVGQYAVGSDYPLTPTAASLLVIVRDRSKGSGGTDTLYQVQSAADDLAVVLNGQATLRFANRQVVVDITDSSTRVISFRVQDGYPTPNPAAFTPTALPASNQLVVGSSVVVTAAGLAIHAGQGSDSKTLGMVLGGERLIIVAGPSAVDGINWWKVSGWDVAGNVGWCNGAFLQRVDPAAEEAGRQIVVGSEVEVTFEALNIRKAADVDSESLATVEQGRRLTVRGGPIKVGGRNWWQVSGWENLGLTGWCSERFLRRVK